MLLIIILLPFICTAQVKKDTIVKKGADSLLNNKADNESNDSSYENFYRFFQSHYFYFNSIGAAYIVEMQKPSLKEVLREKQITPKEMAETNLKNIMAEIKTEVEDKRPWWLKILEDVLGIATKIAVVGLAVAQLLK